MGEFSDSKARQGGHWEICNWLNGWHGMEVGGKVHCHWGSGCGDSYVTKKSNGKGEGGGGGGNGKEGGPGFEKSPSGSGVCGPAMEKA